MTTTSPGAVTPDNVAEIARQLTPTTREKTLKSPDQDKPPEAKSPEPPKEDVEEADAEVASDTEQALLDRELMGLADTLAEAKRASVDPAGAQQSDMLATIEKYARDRQELISEMRNLILSNEDYAAISEMATEFFTRGTDAVSQGLVSREQFEQNLQEMNDLLNTFSDYRERSAQLSEEEFPEWIDGDYSFLERAGRTFLDIVGNVIGFPQLSPSFRKLRDFNNRVAEYNRKQKEIARQAGLLKEEYLLRDGFRSADLAQRRLQLDKVNSAISLLSSQAAIDQQRTTMAVNSNLQEARALEALSEIESTVAEEGGVSAALLAAEMGANTKLGRLVQVMGGPDGTIKGDIARDLIERHYKNIETENDLLRSFEQDAQEQRNEVTSRWNQVASDIAVENRRVLELMASPQVGVLSPEVLETARALSNRSMDLVTEFMNNQALHRGAKYYDVFDGNLRVIEAQVQSDADEFFRDAPAAQALQVIVGYTPGDEEGEVIPRFRSLPEVLRDAITGYYDSVRNSPAEMRETLLKDRLSSESTNAFEGRVRNALDSEREQVAEEAAKQIALNNLADTLDVSKFEAFPKTWETSFANKLQLAKNKIANDLLFSLKNATVFGNKLLKREDAHNAVEFLFTTDPTVQSLVQQTHEVLERKYDVSGFDKIFDINNPLDPFAMPANTVIAVSNLLKGRLGEDYQNTRR